MKEIYCVILQWFLATRETVQVQADDISVDDEGVRLYDGERCVAFFCHEIFRGVYRPLPDLTIQLLPEQEKAEKLGRVDQRF